MNKNKKNCIFALAGLFVLIMTVASVSADDEPNLIAPGPDADEEPSLIAPMDTIENQDALSEGNSTAIIFVAGIVGAVVLLASLIIFKKKT